MSSGTARPTFAVSSRSTPLLACDDLIQVARGAAVSGVDLDLTGSALRRRLTHAKSLSDLSDVLSTWIPPTNGSLDDLLARAWSPRGSLVVVDEERGSMPNGKRQLGAAIRLRGVVPASTRVALAIRPRNPEAGRAHLTRLALLRNLAAEWDLDLALDLSGPVDWLWEAEAAVYRLGPRLRLLRITFPLPTLDAHTRSRLTQRTLAASVDTAFDGLIAVVCPMPIWQWRASSALERSTRTAVERLAGRFGITPLHAPWNVPQRSPAP
ncbi:MAG: hypothetical protein QOG89_2073 [Thermomicrobiales bacterium]|nr:hypothetical protein [Thermomicrobiales bacterium]